ncbi:MFS transporter [Actinokineospora sp. HUAS TT18]|uniref:MFS transporter n=1 Tax=Actinokineospora sp. HUAS TT18 TaxID=3447451 RepID=UPI003F5241DB
MRTPVLGSALARLPIIWVSLSLLLYVERKTGSFAAAGLASGAALIGVAAGSVIQGRLIDRLGPTRPLLIATGAFGLFVSATILAVELLVPVPLLAVVAFGIGATQPLVGAASRALWERMVPAGPARTAGYAYEAISLEVFFILGPGIAGLLIAAPWAGTGLATGAAVLMLGATWFSLNRVVRAWTPTAAPTGNPLGAFASAGMRTVVLAVLGLGLTIGFVEVAVPAAAVNAGNPPLGGLLLSLWSATSVLFGVLYAMRPWPRPMHLRLPFLLATFGVLTGLVAIPTSVLWLGIALVMGGALIAPQSTAHSAVIEHVAPEGTAAEAFGWVLMGGTVGIAIGQATGGLVVEYLGIPAAFLGAGCSAVGVATFVWLFRDTVRRGSTSTASRVADGETAGSVG